MLFCWTRGAIQPVTFRRTKKNIAARRAPAVFMIGVLVMFLFMPHYCAHIHVLPNGQIVVHSHALPQGAKSNSTHSHNYLSLIYLNQVSNAGMLSGLGLFFLLLLLLFAQLCIVAFSTASLQSYTTFRRRGPPVLFA